MNFFGKSAPIDSKEQVSMALFHEFILGLRYIRFSGEAMDVDRVQRNL